MKLRKETDSMGEVLVPEHPPILIYDAENLALSARILRSDAMAMENPMPDAAPCMQEIIGWGI